MSRPPALPTPHSGHLLPAPPRSPLSLEAKPPIPSSALIHCLMLHRFILQPILSQSKRFFTHPHITPHFPHPNTTSVPLPPDPNTLPASLPSSHARSVVSLPHHYPTHPHFIHPSPHAPFTPSLPSPGHTHPCLTKSRPNPCPHQVATCLQLLSNDTDVDVVYFACLVCTLYHRYLTCD